MTARRTNQVTALKSASGYALALGTLALRYAASITPAAATTVTDHVTFSDVGTYEILSPPNAFPHGYQNKAVASGSFDITFDPTQVLFGSVPGAIYNLSYSVTDPYFGSSQLL